MPRYSYQTQDNRTAYFEAATPELAIQNAPNIAPKSGVQLEPVPKEIGAMTTDMAAGYIQKDNETLDRLSGISNVINQKTGEKIPIGQQGQQIQQPQPEKLGTIKFLNQDNQTKELSGESITPESYQSLINQGFFAIESSGNVPSWATTGDIETGRANAELLRMRKEKDDLLAGLKSFTVTDEQLNSQVSGIEKLYNVRIKDMEEINRRREQTVKTLGIRTGSRYLGGEGGVFGGIISAEERAGVDRISDLEAKKQQAIVEARDAARTKNWQVYSKQVESAETQYKEQLETVKELNKKIVEQNKKVQEQKSRSSRDSAIADLISQGITDPTKLLDMLNYDEKGNLIGDISMEEISKVIESIKKSTNSSDLDGDIKEWKQLLDLGSEQGGLSAGTSFLQYQKMKTIAGGQGKATGDIAQSIPNLSTILYNVGIPTAVSTSKGELNKSYYDKSISAGLAPQIVNGLWKNIIAGNTFEEIRQGIREQGGDPAVLDKFIPILQGGGGGGIKNPF